MHLEGPSLRAASSCSEGDFLRFSHILQSYIMPFLGSIIQSKGTHLIRLLYESGHSLLSRVLQRTPNILWIIQLTWKSKFHHAFKFVCFFKFSVRKYGLYGIMISYFSPESENQSMTNGPLNPVCVRLNSTGHNGMVLNLIRQRQWKIRQVT